MHCKAGGAVHYAVGRAIFHRDSHGPITLGRLLCSRQSCIRGEDWEKGGIDRDVLVGRGGCSTEVGFGGRGVHIMHNACVG